MHDSSPPLARRDLIADRLTSGTAVMAADLAREFAVSEDAIRRDLRALAQAGICRRVYGGALPPERRLDSLPMAQRVTEGLPLKQELARAALGLIRPGSCLFLDTGSTVLELAHLLPRDMGLHVVTPSIPVAATLINRTDLTLDVIGGRASAETGGCSDPQARDMLGRLRFDLAFIGACAFDPATGLTAFDPAEVEIKRQVLATARRSCVMLSTDKLGRTAPWALGPAGAVSHFIIDPSAPDAVEQALRGGGSTVIRAMQPDPRP